MNIRQFADQYSKYLWHSLNLRELEYLQGHFDNYLDIERMRDYFQAYNPHELYDGNLYEWKGTGYMYKLPFIGIRNKEAWDTKITRTRSFIYKLLKHCGNVPVEEIELIENEDKVIGL